MAELTQGQRNLPYEGANIFGAAVAGRETPVGTGLQPEAEAMLRIELMKAAASIARTEMELATQSITSYANVNTAVINARANAIAAVSGYARTVGLDNERVQEAIKVSLGLEQSARYLAGVPKGNEKVGELLIKDYDLYWKRLKSQEGIQSIGSRLVEKTNTNQKLLEIQRIAAENAAQFLNGVEGQVSQLKLAGAPVDEIVGTKLQAQSYVKGLIDETYRQAYNSLSDKTDPESVKTRQALLSEQNQMNIKATAEKLAKEQNQGVAITSAEQADLKAKQNQAREDHESYRIWAESANVNLPPELLSGLMESLDLNQKIIDEGPEGFADSLLGMKAPIEVQKVKQSIQNQLEQLDRPSDPLSDAVYKYVTSIPYYENYMAAMGFDDVYDFYKYSSNNLQETVDYEAMVSALVSDPDSADDVLKPEVIRERLRVAGSSGEKGLFRNKNLTRKIERLVGFAVNRGPAWRHFEGTNSKEQLDNAINVLESLGEQEFDNTVKAVETGGLPSDDMPGDDDEPPVRPEELDELEGADAQLAGEFGDPGKRKRVLSAAEKFRERIGGKPRESEEAEEVFTLKGLQPKYVDPPSPEVAAPVEPPKPPKKRYPGGVGGRGKTLDEARRLAQEQSATTPEEPEAGAGSTGPGPLPGGERFENYMKAVAAFEQGTGKKATPQQKFSMWESMVTGDKD